MCNSENRNLLFSFDVSPIFFWKVLFVSLLIVFPVMLFNFSFIFIDALVKDDGWWFQLASEGLGTDTSRGRVSLLTPYLDLLYGQGMVYWGLPFIRSIYVVIMGLCSLMAFSLYRHVLGLAFWPSIVAAITPNILPGVTEIPASLNSSYAVWGLLPILISFLFLWASFICSGWQSYIWFTISFAFFLIGMNLTMASIFLVPSIIIFCFMFSLLKPFKAIIYNLLVTAYGIYYVYLTGKVYPEKLVDIPIEIIIYRLAEFFRVASLWPVKAPYSVYLAVLFCFIGITALATDATRVSRQPSHFPNLKIYRLSLVSWIIVWLVGTSFSYIALVHQFESYRHSYVFNYGAVLAQVIGVFWVFSKFMDFTKFSKYNQYAISALLALGIITVVGIGRINTGNTAYYGLERTSALIRTNLKEQYIPKNVQVLILGFSPPHQGSIESNSGYIRYLLARKDLTALIGNNVSYPHDIFARGGGPWKSMQGFNLDKPIVAFRRHGNSLEPVNYLFRVQAKESDNSSLRWTIYDLNDPKTPPMPIKNGTRLTEYFQFIDRQEDIGADIAFGPDEFSEQLLLESQATKAIGTNLLQEPINFEDLLILKGVEPLFQKEGIRLKLLIKVNRTFHPNFILCYIINGKIQLVGMGKYATKGDSILVITPFISGADVPKSISLRFANRAHKLPLIPLKVVSGALVGQDLITIQIKNTLGSPEFQ